MPPSSYTPVPGSATLVTRPQPEAGPVAELEALDPAAPGGRLIEGEWLGRAVVRAGHVPVLLDVYDRLALDQEPEEQALYGHLYRLALAEERNWCRVSRRELCTRTRLSDRRLGKALAGLVEKGHVRLIERDKRGTLYRVRLPHEVFGEPDQDRVHFPGASRSRAGASAPSRSAAPPLGSEGPTPARAAVTAAREVAAAARPPAPAASGAAAAAREVSPAAAGPSPVAHKAGAAVREASPPSSIPSKDNTLSKTQSVGELAAAFLERFGESRGRSRAEVLEEILNLLEEGRSLDEAAEALRRFGARAPRQTPISELGRFLQRERG